MSAPKEHMLVLPDPDGRGKSYTVMCYEHGDPANPNVLVCVHGLSRNGRDFDYVAQRLSSHYRVLCPDMPGRGKSPKLANPTDYNYSVYVSVCRALLQAYNLKSVDWLGTSMGGIIGMFLAPMHPNLIRKLILNDIGAFIPKEGLARISAYVGKYPRYDTEAEMRAYLENIFTLFSIREPEHQEHMYQYGVRRTEDGKYELAYDPAILEPTKRESKNYTDFKDVDLWPVWNATKCPVLILRGAESDILLEKTALEMLSSRDGVTLKKVPGVGHAPALMENSQIDIIEDWLLHTSAKTPSWLGKLTGGALSSLRRWIILRKLNAKAKQP